MGSQEKDRTTRRTPWDLNRSLQTPAHEAAYLLVRNKIGCLPVVNKDGFLVGIVTETDFVSAACILLGGRVPVDELELEEHEADRV